MTLPFDPPGKDDRPLSERMADALQHLAAAESELAAANEGVTRARLQRQSAVNRVSTWQRAFDALVNEIHRKPGAGTKWADDTAENVAKPE